jgi:hypothetical protein
MKVQNKKKKILISVMKNIICKSDLLGTPEMSRSGRRTLKALRAFTSNPSICKLAKIELTTLKKGRKKKLLDSC